MSIDLETLSAGELDALISAAAEQKKRIHRQRLADVRNKLIAMAKDEGYTIEELFDSGKSRGSAARTGRTVAPKYRNPDDADQTWTGRGKRPRWFQAALDAGKSIESLTI